MGTITPYFYLLFALDIYSYSGVKGAFFLCKNLYTELQAKQETVQPEKYLRLSLGT